MKKSNLYMLLALGVIIIVGAAAYFGNSEAFQGKLSSNQRFSNTVRGPSNTIRPSNKPTVSNNQLTFNIEGTVTEIREANNGNPFSIQVGDSLSGTYSYSKNSFDSNNLSTVADYWYNTDPNGMKLNIRHYEFKTDPNNVRYLYEISNDHPGGEGYDGIVMHSYNNVVNTREESLVEHISWQLDDFNGTALSNTYLPTECPTLGDWEQPFGLTIKITPNPADRYKSDQMTIKAEITNCSKV